MEAQRGPGGPLWRAGEALLLLALGLFADGPALTGRVLWDDAGHITPPALRSLAGLGRIWSEPGAAQQYYPVLHTAFWLEHRLWGDATIGYHLLNVLLQVTAALLLVRLLRRLAVPGAYLAGALFVAHPVAVESVAWLSEQKNTLSLVFYLAAALAYLDFEERRTARSYAAASAWFVLALLAKSVTATLPAALLVLAWWRRGRVDARRDVAPLAPWLAIAAGCGMLTAWVERTEIGARGPDFALGLAQRLLLAGRVIWFYLGKLIWPVDLSFVYPRWNAAAAGLAWAPWLLAALGLTAILGWWRTRSRAPLAVWLLFVGSLVPVLGFVNVYPFVFSYVADHFQYLACLSVLAAVAAGLHRILGRRRWLAAVPVAVLALLAHAQSRIYRDPETLWKATIARNPACWLAHYNLGLLLNGDHRPEEAMAHFEAALAARPGLADAANDWGNALANFPDRLPEAIAKYRQALRLKPDFAEAHNNLGNALARLPGGGAEAEEHYRAALRLKPEYAEAHNDLGFLWLNAGRPAAAAEEFETALRVQPGYATARYNLANAHNDLAVAAANSGRRGEALTELRTALQLAPDLETARRNLEQLGAER